MAYLRPFTSEFCGPLLCFLPLLSFGAPFKYLLGLPQYLRLTEEALLSCAMGSPQRAELSVLLDDVGQVERGVFFGCLYVGVPHYLLERAQIAALHQVVFAEGVAEAVRPQLRSLDARFLHVTADYGIDKMPRDWALVTVKYMVARAFGRKLEEESPSLIGNRNLAPARFALNHHRFLSDVVLEEGAHLTGPYSVVHYQGQYRPIPRVLSGLKESH